MKEKEITAKFCDEMHKGLQGLMDYCVKNNVHFEYYDWKLYVRTLYSNEVDEILLMIADMEDSILEVSYVEYSVINSEGMVIEFKKDHKRIDELKRGKKK